MRLRNRFKPNGLPNTRDGGVPDAVRIVELLADRLRAFVGGIPNFDDEFLRALFDRAGQIDGEGAETALMMSDFDPVEVDVGAPVDGSELQEDFLAVPVLGDFEGCAIPEVILGADVLRDAGKSGFRAEGDEDLTLSVAELFADGKDRVIPQTVEVLPRVARHLRTRILGKGLRRIDVLRKFREKNPFRRAPFSRERGKKRAARDHKAREKCDCSGNE